MAKFDIQAFFNNIEGKTWSLGSAFKRADALPLDLYSVWKTKAEAEAYATSHATAYPGQILVVVEKENNIDVIKLYYIDENRELQEVGSATLGDEKTIVLDPESKILSIKGFDNAGFVTAVGDVYKADGKYFSLVNGKYVAKEDAPTIDSDGNITDENCYKRIGVKLIKDDTGALSWISDDAVQIQAEIGGLKTTVINHEERIGALEDDVEDLRDDLGKEISSLGTVFNFVGSLTVNEFAATTGTDSIIDTDKTIPSGDRAYRAGDVIFVTVPVSDEPNAAIKYTQEYVATATKDGLIWEAFGDPTGVAGIESRVATLESTATTHTNDLALLNNTVETEGSVKHTAKGYADAAIETAEDYTDVEVAKVKAIADANAQDINGKAAQGEPGTEGYVPAVVGLKDKAATNATNISNLDKELNGDSTSTDDKIKAGIKGRVSKLETESAKASDLQALDREVDALSNNLKDNYSTSTIIAQTYETIENVNSVRTTVSNNTKAIQDNTNAISAINVQLNGADGKGGLAKTVEGLITTTEGHGTKISAIEGKLDTINGTGAGSIAEAKAAADAAQTSANNAQKDATQALADAAAASQLAGTKATLADVAKVGYALDTDAQQYAKDVQGNTKETVASTHALASKANTAADNAQAAANAAQGTANQALAEFANYTKTTDMNAAIAAVISDGNDSKDDITVKGTRLYAQDLADSLQTSINNINTALADLTTVMNFVGVFEILPLANGYNKGDVCIVDTQEYVLVETTVDEIIIKNWEPFGTVTADAARFEAIEKVIGAKDTDGSLIPGTVGTLLKDVDDLQTLTNNLKSTSDGYATRFTNAEGRITVVENKINDTVVDGATVKGIASRLTDVEGVAAAAATQEALNKEISDRGVAEAALDKKITDGFAGQKTTNDQLQANIDAIYKVNEDGTDSGFLTWGTF